MKTLLLFLAIIGLAHGQTIDSPHTPAPNSSSTNDALSPRENTVDQEIAVLRAQLATIEKYNERILNTVHWSVGIALSLLTLLVGAGWFTNFRVSKAAQEQTSSELTAKIAAQLKVAEERLQKQIEPLTSELRKSITLSAKNCASHVEAVRTRSEKMVGDLELTIHLIEAEAWRTRKVHANSLRTYLQALEIAIGLGREFRITQVLDKIMELVRDPSELKFSIDTDLRRNMTELFSKVPDSHRLTKDAIIAGVQKMPH